MSLSDLNCPGCGIPLTESKPTFCGGRLYSVDEINEWNKLYHAGNGWSGIGSGITSSPPSPTTTPVFKFDNLPPSIRVKQDDNCVWVLGDDPEIDKLAAEKMKPVKNPYAKCECGVDIVGSGLHSDWCPKADPK